MSNVIDRIKKRITTEIDRLIEFDKSIGKISDETTFKLIGLQRANNYIDEELAKESQENSQARMIVESLSSLHNLKDFEEQAIEEILNNQPQVQLIVRSAEEVAKCLAFDGTRGYKDWIDWLTKKGV